MYNPFSTKSEIANFNLAIEDYEANPDAARQAAKKLVVKQMVRAAVITTAVVVVGVTAMALMPNAEEETEEEIEN